MSFFPQALDVPPPVSFNNDVFMGSPTLELDECPSLPQINPEFVTPIHRLHKSQSYQWTPLQSLAIEEKSHKAQSLHNLSVRPRLDYEDPVQQLLDRMQGLPSAPSHELVVRLHDFRLSH